MGGGRRRPSGAAASPGSGSRRGHRPPWGSWRRVGRGRAGRRRRRDGGGSVDGGGPAARTVGWRRRRGGQSGWRGWPSWSVVGIGPGRRDRCRRAGPGRGRGGNWRPGRPWATAMGRVRLAREQSRGGARQRGRGVRALVRRRSTTEALSSPDWWAVLAELDRRRARALSALDSDLIEDYAQPGSAAWDSGRSVAGRPARARSAPAGAHLPGGRGGAFRARRRPGPGAGRRPALGATPSSMRGERWSRACPKRGLTRWCGHR